MTGENESIGGTAPIQSRLIDHHRINNDPRMLPAVELYSTHKEGAFLLYKTTRAGCTTALVSESVNRMEQFTAIVPTNNIAKDTIIEKAKKYSDVKPKTIVKAGSNHECTKNKELIRQYPVLDRLPILPLADKCNECEYYSTCDVTKILREPNAEGFVLTYSKLVALMMASENGIETRAQQILDVVDKSKNFIFDEVHELQYGQASSITVYKDVNVKKNIDLTKYDSVDDKFNSLQLMINTFKEIIKDENVKRSVKEVYDASLDPDYWKHHLRTTVFNRWKTDKMDTGKFAMACYKEVMELAIKKDEYGLEINDITRLYDMLNIVIGEKITIHAIREDGFTAVNMVSRNWFFLSAIGSFLMSIENKNKRLWLTSATICSYDYSNLFMHTSPKQLFYAGNGDPINSNEKMLIIADTKKYYNRGNRSKWNRQDEIVEKSQNIIKSYGLDNCFIICTNSKDYSEFKQIFKETTPECEPYITYYKATDTMGVESEKRICIAIGAAQKPANAFDAITESREQSDILKEEAMHCDTWQAWSRVKDPSGKEKSIVFALGINEQECKNIVTWGNKREVKIHKNKEKKTKNKSIVVNCDKEITKPKTVALHNYSDYLSLAYDWKQPIKKINLSSEKCDNSDRDSLINIYTRDSLSKTTQHSEVRLVFSESELLDEFINRYDAFAEQTHNGKAFFKVPATVTPQLLQNHADGKITIGAYTLNLDNKVRWICYDVDAHRNKEDNESTIKEKQMKSETDKNTICKFFENRNIPYILECSGTPYSYHIWVLLEPVNGFVAKDFAESILKFLDLNHESFPKQGKLKDKQGYGNLVKLPLAINKKNGNKSKLFHDGEWITQIPESGFPIRTIDISGWEEHMKENKKEQRNFDKRMNYRLKQEIKKGNVRPCIKEALTKTLTGTQGHAMRIAIAREFSTVAKFSDEQIAELFKNQADYDFNKSLEQVKSITSVKMYPWKCSTLRSKCSDFVNCIGCKLRRGE